MQKDTKEQELDITQLDKLLGVDNEEEDRGFDPAIIQQIMEIDEEIDYNDPVSILKINIKRANRILDYIQMEMLAGNFTARMVEVAGAIINGVTAASKEIITKENYEKYIDIRKELNDLKEREVVVKEQKLVKGSGVKNQQNIILTSREDLLKLMNKDEPIPVGETKKIPERTN